ncbi:hypothetical protein RJ640_019098 [Escallonia rubra]|uniref:Bidirectional sugar transporter SWEET n=1 Tax=Escallonia rubra TaxID=112253 RepID=A0AA88RGP1_9ASTE|nr:hypothetical protein RJ640_019098 [Escallonia rubra]
MISRDAARTAVGIIGRPTFVRIVKKGAVEQYSPAPYLATLVNCGLWVVYGLPMVHPHSTLVLTINGSGFAIELVYLLLFLIYSDRKKRLKVLLIMLAEFAFIAVLALLVLTLTHSIKLRSAIVGSISVFGCFLMYASPLSIMKLVITTKSVEYMPLFLSLASFANGICWTSYALIRFDPFIAVNLSLSLSSRCCLALAAPNGMGLLLGIAQLVLYAAFYKSTKQQIAARESKVELGLADAAVSADSKKIRSEPPNRAGGI